MVPSRKEAWVQDLEKSLFEWVAPKSGSQALQLSDAHWMQLLVINDWVTVANRHLHLLPSLWLLVSLETPFIRGSPMCHPGLSHEGWGRP